MKIYFTMYKILLVILLTLTLNAFGNENDLIFSGQFNFNAGYDKTKNKNQKDTYGLINGEFNLKNLTIFGEEDKVRYGFKINSVFNSEDSSNLFKINEANFIISVKNRGMRIFGFQNSVASKMRIDTTTFNSTSKGVNGVWQNFLTFPSNSFITTQGMALENGFSSSYFLANSEDVNETGSALRKQIQPFSNWGDSNLGLSYVSDRTQGFRFGIFYAPSNQHSLLFKKNNLTDKKDNHNIKYQSDTFLENIFSTSLNYYDALGNIEFAFSIGYENAKTVSKIYDRRNLSSYSIGANLSYLGFTIGGSFTDFQKSMQIKNDLIIGSNAYYKNGILTESNKNYVFDIGIGYAIDKYSGSLSYIQSKYVGNIFWSGVASFETQVSKNLATYFQVVKYQFESADQTVKISNKKTNSFIFNIGIKYIF